MPGAKNETNRGAALRYAGLGVELAVSVALGALAGQWVDRKTGARGIFTIVGALLGFGATMYALIRGLRSSDQDRE